MDGRQVASGPLPGMFFFPNLSTAGIGMFVGRDRGFAVGSDYRPPFAVHRGAGRCRDAAAEAPEAGPDDDTRLRTAVASD